MKQGLRPERAGANQEAAPRQTVHTGREAPVRPLLLQDLSDL